MENSVDMKKLRARVSGHRNLAAELQVGKRKRNETSESSEASSLQKAPSDHGPFDSTDAGHISPSCAPVLPTPATAATISGAAAIEIAPEVINLERSSEGGTGSPPKRVTNQPSTDMVTLAPLTSSGPIRLDHLSVTSPGIQSNWHVNRQAKDLSQVYLYDAELMGKVGGVRCFEAGSIMLARCLAIMQHHRQVAEGEVRLRDRLGSLEQQVEGLSKIKENLEQDVLGLKEANADKDSPYGKGTWTASTMRAVRAARDRGESGWADCEGGRGQGDWVAGRDGQKEDWMGGRASFSSSSLYAPLWRLSVTLKGPSQFRANLPFCRLRRAVPTFLHTKSPFRNARSRTRVLYWRAALSLAASSRILASSRTSCIKSRLARRLLSLFCSSKCVLRHEGSPSSTGIIASVPYVRRYGVSFVEDWGVQW